MPYEKNLFATAEERNNLSGEPIYGELSRDWFFLEDGLGVEQFRRFAPLARKALRHYAKVAYNISTIDRYTERMVRKHICNFMRVKVEEKVQYDWEFIDNCMKMVIGDLLKIDIPYDEARLSYLIPEAQVHADWEKTMH
ncbi:MAG: hypothetical protein E2604_16925 [Flavobacterium sp.]|nr:hypothetical protein [Flavobacterium sp.]